MKKKYRWTPFKIITLSLATACLLGACSAKSQENPDAALGFLVGTAVFGGLFGLLNVDSTFNRGS